MRTVRNANVTGKKILYRVDFNLPVDEDGKPSDDSRILSVIPTLEWVLRHKPEQVIVLTHWGRPEGKDAKWQLMPVAQHLAKILKTKQLVSSEKVITKEFKDVGSPILERRYYIGRSITMLENLRFDSAEEKNSDSLAKKIAVEADIYVNDAFATCHRAHTSIVAITKYLPAFAGMLLANEVQQLEPLLAKQEKPFVVVIGGAKVEDKIPIINHFRKKADTILVGGKTSADYFAAMTEPVEKLVFPVDSIDAKGRIAPFDKETIEKNPPFDIGPDTIVKFKSILKSAKTVFWNGPLGMAEDKKFYHGSYEIARFIANLRATTIASGGDTDAVIEKLGLHKHFSFISTGGGAASEYLIGKKLPGLMALEENAGIKPKIA